MARSGGRAARTPTGSAPHVDAVPDVMHAESSRGSPDRQRRPSASTANLRRKLPGGGRADTFLSRRFATGAASGLPAPGRSGIPEAGTAKKRRGQARNGMKGWLRLAGAIDRVSLLLRLDRGLARAPQLPDQRRQRRLALPLQPQLERLARDPVADVRRHLPARRAVRAASSTSTCGSTCSTARRSPRRKLWIDVVGIVLLPASRRCWSSSTSPGRSSSRASRSGEISSNAGGLLLWPVKLLLPFGFALAAPAGRRRAGQAHRRAARRCADASSPSTRGRCSERAGRAAARRC